MHFPGECRLRARGLTAYPAPSVSVLITRTSPPPRSPGLEASPASIECSLFEKFKTGRSGERCTQLGQGGLTEIRALAQDMGGRASLGARVLGRGVNWWS